MLGALALPSIAVAGACCTGSTTTVPTRLGECEKAIAVVGTSVEASVGRWDNQWRSARSSLHEQAIVTTLGGAWRWDRKGQIGISVPFRVNHKQAGDLSTWGGGIGNIRVSALYDPFSERATTPDRRGSPVPVFSLGLRLPTGRSVQQADDLLMADVTGLAETAILGSVQIERTLDRMPWSVSLGTELGIGKRGVQPTLTASGSVGSYIGQRWSLLGTLRHTSSWTPTLHDGHAHAASTAAGVRVTVGQLLRWRGWLAVESDLPYLGRDRMQLVSGSVGVAIVR